jgi:hypothetical protein
MRRREFGSLRHLPSGRWQARYPGSDGRLRPAPQTFPSRQAAAGWLASLQTDLARGAWVDPACGEEPFANYATAWLAQRVDLRPRTRSCTPGFSSGTCSPTSGRPPWRPCPLRWGAAGTPSGCGPGWVSRRSPRPTGCSRRSSTPRWQTRSCCATPACCAGSPRSGHPSGYRPRWSRPTRSPTPSTSAGGCSSSSRCGRGCAGASSPPCAAARST